MKTSQKKTAEDKKFGKKKRKEALKALKKMRKTAVVGHVITPLDWGENDHPVP